MLKRKKTFELTSHCEKRMEERSIPHPNDVGLVPANRKTKKLIRESCKKEGFKSDYVYWTVLVQQERLVYVCVQKDIAHYIVLTCFKYPSRTPKQSKAIENKELDNNEIEETNSSDETDKTN